MIAHQGLHIQLYRPLYARILAFGLGVRGVGHGWVGDSVRLEQRLGSNLSTLDTLFNYVQWRQFVTGRRRRIWLSHTLSFCVAVFIHAILLCTNTGPINDLCADLTAQNEYCIVADVANV